MTDGWMDVGVKLTLNYLSFSDWSPSSVRTSSPKLTLTSQLLHPHPAMKPRRSLFT